MAILKYNASPNPKASLANINYILRDSACVRFETVNLPEIKTEIDARSYGEMRMLEENLAPKRGTGIARNHHRMLLTMPEEIDPERAMELVKKFIEEEFPGTRSIIAVHKSENGIGLHSHMWLDARKLDGKKIDLGNKYTKLDKLYSKMYDKEYETNYTQQFAEARKFNAENKINTYSNSLKKLVEAQERNEQNRIRSGKFIIERANSAINKSNQKIAEFQQLNEYGNKLELARINRASLESGGSKNSESRKTELQPLGRAEIKPKPDRSRKTR